MNRKVLITVAIITTLAGCQTPTATTHAISFEGDIERSNSEFSMNGKVDVSAGASEPVAYGVVEVRLYDSDKDLIRSYSVGRMGTSGTEYPMEKEFTISSKQVPEYVVLYSENLWTNTKVYGYRRGDEYYYSYEIESKDNLF